MRNYKKHVIILGSARSGTSWLSEMMAQKKRYRMLFEPEQENRTKKGHLLCDRWLQHKADSKAANRYLKEVFSNRVDCDWIAQNSNRKFKRHLWPLIPKKFVIKFVRCNLLGSYLSQNFGIPVIHLHRNPYEVLASQSRVNFPWLEDLARFKSQDKLVNSIIDRFNFDIRNTEDLSILQLRTLRWCIENVLPLEVFPKESENYKIVSYTDIRGDINNFYELCEKFEVELIENIADFYSMPSSKAHREGVINNKVEIEKMFTEGELQDINEILDIFETNLYPRLRL